MKKYFILLITIFFNMPFFYSCTPDIALDDQNMYENIQGIGDDDDTIVPPNEKNDTITPIGNNHGFGGL